MTAKVQSISANGSLCEARSDNDPLVRVPHTRWCGHPPRPFARWTLTSSMHRRSFVISVQGKAEYPNYMKKAFHIEKLSDGEKAKIIEKDKNQYLAWLHGRSNKNRAVKN